MKKLIVTLLTFYIAINAVSSQEILKDTSEFSELKGNYFGQKPPGNVPELFAPEIFDAEHGYHSTVIFSQDLTEALWSPMTREGEIMYTKMTNGIWATPEKAIFGPISNADAGMFSSDGNRLYFTSFHTPQNSDIEREHIWFVNRIGEGWSKPELIDEVIRAHPTHWTFSFATNGNLYFTSEIEGVRGEQDIYVSRFDGEKYIQPEDLGLAINSDGIDLCPYISPDESYLIFTRKGEGTKETDLYISFKNSRGKWTEAVDMGKNINSGHHDLGPSISPDGKFLFFISRREGNNNIYWVDASIIDELKNNH